MSPILIFLGISGRFIFFTAETARAGAPAKPACVQSEEKHKSGKAGYKNIQYQYTQTTDVLKYFHGFTQLERPHGNCVWNEMGYLDILIQKEKTAHTFLLLW